MMILILLVSYAFAISDNPQKSIFGYRYYEVLSSSMSPILQKGDIIFVKMLPINELQVGDMITYQIQAQGESTVTHRILKIYQEGYKTMIQTKGDASSEPDYPIQADAVIGKVVFRIPVLGMILSFFKKYIGFMMIACLTGVLGKYWLKNRKRGIKNG